jgi:phosphatidylinositol-3-phosphatase
MSVPKPQQSGALAESYAFLQRLVGIIAVLLPVVVALGDWVIDGHNVRGSISSYYYGRTGGYFVGSLCALAVFFLSYRYKADDEYRADRRLSVGASLAALGVALFPTTSDVGRSTFGGRVVGTVHLLSAGVLFLLLAVFSLYQFTKSDPQVPMTMRKRRRNRVYQACGWVIVACIVLIGVSNLAHWRLLFWLETVAVVAFGFSWLVKSGFIAIFNDKSAAGPLPPPRHLLAGTLSVVALLGGTVAVGELRQHVGCGSMPALGATVAPTEPRAVVQHVFVIAMENHDRDDVYTAARAPFLDQARHDGARATGFTDALAFDVLSEPHYVMLEAGTNQFIDRSFCTDNDPTSLLSSPTSSRAHLTAQMEAAKPAISWMSYQEGIAPGVCPIHSVKNTNFAPKHDPFVFFADIVGKHPTTSAPNCVMHHRPYDTLAADLTTDSVAQYVFVTPDLTHDMHNACALQADTVKCGDDWLKTELPPIITYANSHGGLVFLVWDEGCTAGKPLPFYAFGPSIAANTESNMAVNHRSLVRTIDEIFGLPILDTVSDDPDLGDLFTAKHVPTANH